MLSAAALLVVGVRLVPVVFKMDIYRSAKTIFDWARDSSDSCGFLAFVRWDLISRGWLGLLTLYVPGSEFALADELGRRRHHRVRRAVVSGRVKVKEARSAGSSIEKD